MIPLKFFVKIDIKLNFFTPINDRIEWFEGGGTTNFIQKKLFCIFDFSINYFEYDT